MPKFEVTRAANEDKITEKAGSGEQSLPATNRKSSGIDADGGTSEQEHLTSMSPDSNDVEANKNLYLYTDDMKHMPRVATFLHGLTHYPATYPSEKNLVESSKRPKKAKLGVLLGVYLPTIQHIFGVLMFVRLSWIVGCSGLIEAFVMVFICCLTTFLTAISMSAIATNGMVQAGGSYFMISRNLGPECGGAVGICFYLANTFATDLYILGSIEILLQYMAPSLAYFGDIHENPFNNFRVYGTVVLLVLSLIVAVGVKFVQLFAPFSLVCVIVSIICIFVGAFSASETTKDVMICMLGDRLLSYTKVTGTGSHGNITGDGFNDHNMWCTKNTSGPVYPLYCGDNNGTSESCDYFHGSNITYIHGIPGMASNVIARNLWSNYLAAGEVTPGVAGSHSRGEIVADITSSFVVVAAIYFPSVTGIMTGSNMSGDLKDPQKSIPSGTIMAQLTCSFVYLSLVLFFGSTTEGALLRDKFGSSIGGQLLASALAWPNPWVVLVGAFCSTIGAALQCLTSAPRLLQAIARDDILPFLNIFKKTTKSGEPIRALVITFFIAEIGIIIASLDYVAHLIDVCFLMCYAFVNLTCALQTLLRSPNWRPRFKYYHWTLSLLGVALNIGLSITAGWYFALAALALAGFVYKYIEYKGGEKAWGDGIQGLSMSAAQRALLKLDEEPHTKNWRPQVLVLNKVQEDLQPKYDKLFSLVSQLKAGRGLTIVASVLQGEHTELKDKLAVVKQHINNHMADNKLKGFAKVMAARDIPEGLSVLVQTIGLGGMRPNTVLLGWPHEWRACHDGKMCKKFLDATRVVCNSDLALLLPRGIETFPDNNQKLSGTIDVWWIIHDGGMLILLSFLLRQHKVWKNCKTRIFTVAQMEDNSIQLEEDLKAFLYHLRIDAEVHVVELYDSDISAYTVERTMDMERRANLLKELHVRHSDTKEANILMSKIVSCPKMTLPPVSSFQIQGIREENRRHSVAAHMHTQVPDTESGPDNHTETKVRFQFASATSLDKDHGTTETGQEQPQASGQHLEADSADEAVQFTFSPLSVKSPPGSHQGGVERQPKPTPGRRLMRMHTAVRLNGAIQQKSGDAQLVILNFPGPPAKLSSEENYMEYLDVLTDHLPRVLMVRGSGKEVVTMYS